MKLELTQHTTREDRIEIEIKRQNEIGIEMNRIEIEMKRQNEIGIEMKCKDEIGIDTTHNTRRQN